MIALQPPYQNTSDPWTPANTNYGLANTIPSTYAVGMPTTYGTTPNYTTPASSWYASNQQAYTDASNVFAPVVTDTKIDASNKVVAPTDVKVAQIDYSPTQTYAPEIKYDSTTNQYYYTQNITQAAAPAPVYPPPPVYTPPPKIEIPKIELPPIQQYQTQTIENKKEDGFSKSLPWLLGGAALLFLAPKLFGGNKTETKAEATATVRESRRTRTETTETPDTDENTPETPTKKDEKTKTKVINITAGGDVAINPNASKSDASNPAKAFSGKGWKNFKNDGNLPGTYEIAKNKNITARYTTKKPSSGSTGTIISKVDVYLGEQKIVATPGKVTVEGKDIKDGYHEGGISFNAGKLVVKAGDDTLTVDVNATSDTSKGKNTPSLAVGYADAREVDEAGNTTEASKNEESGALLDLNEIKSPTQEDIKKVFNANKK